jgi:uncharacterized peroxidase-related enzyme
MTRISTVSPAAASGATAEVFNAIKKSIRMIPNSFATVGTHTPEGLSVMLQLDQVIAHSTLSKADNEVIRLVVSQLAHCDYCLAAHTMLGKMAGLSADTIKQVRAGMPSGDAKRDALVHFVRLLSITSGTIEEAELQALLAAGYSERQVIEISMAIAAITFTNLINRINDTKLDFPKAD